MVQSDDRPSNPSAVTGKKTGAGSPRLLRSLPAVYVLGLLLLAIFIGGFIWHDLRGAYHDALAYWNVRLSGSAQDRVRIIALWLSERRTDAEAIAEDPLAGELLQTPKGRATDAARLLQRKLEGIEEARGFVTGLIVDTGCHIVARSGSPEVTAKDLQTSCASVYRAKHFDVEFSHLEKNGIWLNLAIPIFVEGRHSKADVPVRRIAGAVILVFAPWKYLYPFVVGENEPAQSIETQVVWRRDKEVFMFLPKREVMHQESVVRRRLGEPVFGAQVAQENEVRFGEFVDYRGIKVFGAAKRIPVSGGSLARKIDVDEALADFHRRAVLEGLAGALCVLLFGVVILAQHRRTGMQDLISKIEQQEALLEVQQQAAASEARYRGLFENASDAIAMFDLQGQVVSVNKAAERAGGYSHDEALRLNFSQLMPPESRDVFEKNLERLLVGRPSPAEEVELIAKDGRRVPMEASSQLVYQRGEPVGIQVIARDITERRQAEEALRRSEERFSKAFRSNPEMASISTLKEGRYLDVNEAFLRALGRSREEVIGKTAVELNFWRDPEARLQFLERLNAEGRVGDVEVHFCAKGGEVRTGLISGEIAEIHGEECLLAVTRDITDRKQTEEALRHREAELKEAQRLAQIGSWEWEVGSDTLSWSDELYRIARRDPKLPPPPYREFPQIYGPETWERLNPLVENCVKTGDPYELEMERTHPDGARKWFIASGEPVRDAAGRIFRLRGTVQDITERKQAELSLQESEERFRSLSEASFEGIAFSEDGKVIDANTRLTQMLGCEMNELIGSMISDWVAPDSLELVMDHVRTGSEEPYESHLRRRDGTTFPAETRARKLPWKGKHVRATTIRDISELKRTEQMLRDLTEGTASVTGADFFSSLVRHSAAALHARYAFVAEYRAPGTAKTLAFWDGEESGEDFEYRLEDAPCLEVLEGKICIHREDVRRLFPNHTSLAKMGAESYLGVPLFDDAHQVIGFLAVIDTKPMPQDPQAVSILEIFAARAGAELERQQALEALQREKAFSEAVIDSLPGFVYVVDTKGEVIRWNRNAETILGYSNQELSALQTLDVIVEDDREIVATSWLETFAEGSTTCEARVLTKDGRRTPFLLSARHASIGDQAYIIGTGIDITGRKQAEEALKKSEARYRSLVEDSLALICTHDLDGTLLSVNPAAAKAWGGTTAELVGRKIQDLLTPKAFAYFADYIERIRTHKSGEGLLEVITKSGEVRYWTYRNVLREEAGKEPFVLGYAQDITERKLAEEKLQEEKTFSDAVIDSLPGAFYVSDESGSLVRWNKNVEKMLGYTSEELAAPNRPAFFPEEDLATTIAKRQEGFVHGQTMHETCVLAKDGKRIPVLLTGIRAVIGDKPYLVGMGIDITDRKRAEEALRESEERFRQMAENSPDMFWLFDLRKAGVLYVSPAFEKVWGRPVQELLSNPGIWREAIHPEDREYITNDFDTRGVTVGAENEFRIVWPDGAVRWVRGSAFPIRDESGAVSRLGGIVYDVTDRREAEDALRRQEKLFHAIVEDQTEMIVRCKPDGTRTFVNAAYGHAFGSSQGELLGTSLFRFLADEDRERIRKKLASLTPDQPIATDVHRTFISDGETRWHEWTDHGLFDAQGRLTEIQSVGRDITERKKAVEELTISEARYRTLIETAPEAIVVLEAETGKFVDFNENACHLFGLPGKELLKQTPAEVSPPLQPDGRPSDLAAVEYIRQAAAGEVPVFEWMHRNAAGVNIPCEVRLVRLPSAGRMLLRGSVTDITERKTAEAALRASQEMFSKAFHSSPEPMCIIAISDSNFLDVNKAFCDQIGYSREEAVGKTAVQLGLDPLSGLSDEQRKVLDQGGLHNLELDLRTRSGDVRTALVSFETVEIAGQPCILAQGRDVTEHRQAERALRSSEQRYRDFISHSKEAVWRVELDEAIPIDLPAEEQMERLLYSAFMAECNDAMAHIVGAARAEDLIGKHLKELIPSTDQERITGFKSAAAGRWQNRTIQFQVTRPTGESRHLQRTEIPIVENGKLIRMWGLTRDVTDLYLAEEAVRASEERYRLLFERSLAGVVRTTLDGRVLECNEAFAKIQGYTSREEVISSNVRDFYLETSDGTTLFDLLKQYPIVIGEEFHTRRRDGSPAWMLVSASLIENQREGPSILATAFDITHWKELGEQLRQSQKMEAVGRLAGGVAHDFNNMLQIINGYSELVIDQLPGEDPLHAHMQEIKGIVERAAGLTRQLLAFSRQQVLAPQILDLNLAIANLSKMLRRLIGEDIELVMHEGHPLSKVKADPGQIDQVILNLAVNARDAMPRGGKLTIETANVEIDGSFALAHFPMTPGPYTMIAVTDAGHGMDAETQARIFEPFFTTKEKGKGTGLGLATVYGIVKQSGGFIWVESEVGKGTTFKVYLPPASEAAAPQRPELAPSMLQGTETVLLVEDEEYVRSLVRKSLQSKGYTVLEARNGEDALRVAREHAGPIHLLITDVVMPGMSGRELAERLAPLRREMKTLYMSGYADDAILHHGVLHSGGALLQKPFTAEALANKVRQVLEQS